MRSGVGIRASTLLSFSISLGLCLIGIALVLSACGASASEPPDAAPTMQADAEAQPSADANPGPVVDGGTQEFGAHVIAAACHNQAEGLRIAISSEYYDNSCYPMGGVESVTLILGTSNPPIGQEIAFSDSGTSGTGYHCPADETINCTEIQNGVIVFEAFSVELGAVGYIQFPPTTGQIYEFDASFCGPATDC